MNAKTGEHWLVADAEVANAVVGEPRDADEQMRELRHDGVVVAVASLPQLSAKGREALRPRGPLVGGNT
jgi:hypothetical protein